MRRYVDGHCLPFDQRSTFGIVPYALYRDDPGGARRFGASFYRSAHVNREDNAWWPGINPHIASTGAALAKAGRLLNRPELGRIAQRQLDFIYGANPFDASAAEGLGHNQPDFFKTTEHVPHTPWISGAIMAGIGSSNSDQPVLLPGCGTGRSADGALVRPFVCSCGRRLASGFFARVPHGSRLAVQLRL